MLLYLTAVIVYLARTHGPAVVNHPATPKVALGTTAACSVGVVGYYGYHYLNSPIPYPATSIALDSHRTALTAMLDDLERPLFLSSTRVICSWTKDPPSPLSACPPLSEPLPQPPTHTFLFSDPLPNSTTVQKNIRLPGRSFNSGLALDVDVDIAPASTIFFTGSSPAAVPAPRHAAKPILILASALVLAMIALNACMHNGSSSDPGLVGKVFEAIMSTIDENEKMTIPPALPPPVTSEGDEVLNIPAVPNDATVPDIVQAHVFTIDIQANATTAEAEHTSTTKPDNGSGVLADHATASLPELPETPKALSEVVNVDGTEPSDVQALVSGLPASIPAITEEEVTQDTPIALDDVLVPDIARILDFTIDGSAPAILPATVAEAEDASTAKVDDGSMVLADQIMTPLPALPEALATLCEVVNDLSEVPSQGSADPSVQAPIGLLVPIPAIIEAELVQDTPAVVDDVKALDIMFAVDVDILPVPAAEVKDVSINNDSAVLAGHVMKALLPALPESLAASCEVVDDLSEIPSQDAAEPSTMQALVTGPLFPIPAIIEEVPSLDVSSHPSYPTAQRPWYRIAHHPFPTRHPIVPNGRETRGSFRRGLSVLVTIPETRTVNVTRERPWCRTALNPSLARHPTIPNGGDPTRPQRMRVRGLSIMVSIPEDEVVHEDIPRQRPSCRQVFNPNLVRHPAIPNGGEMPLQYHNMCGLTLHRGLCVLRAILEELDEDEDGYGDEDDYEDEDDYDESEYEHDEDEYDEDEYDDDEYDGGDEDEDEEIIRSRPLYRQILNPFLVCHPAVPNGGETPLPHQQLSPKMLHRGLCILIVVPEELEDDDEDLEEDDEDGEGEGSDDAASPYPA